jgi:hypothetical protein
VCPVLLIVGKYLFGTRDVVTGVYKLYQGFLFAAFT